MVILTPVLLLAALMNTIWPDVSIVVFRHHPGRVATKEGMEARDADKDTIFAALRMSKIGYMYSGGLGTGYNLAVQIVDLPRWHDLVDELHKAKSLKYYTQWNKDADGIGLIQRR